MQQQANQQYFEMVIRMTNEGGKYIWPDAGETYTVRDGSFYGTKKGVKKMKSITPKGFHSRIKLA